MKNKIVLFLVCIVCCRIAAASDVVSHLDTIKALREVSVTAIKQAANVRMLPVSSTVIGTSEIERQGIESMKNVSGVVPNFYMPDYGSRMTSTIYVRGLGARIDQPVVGLNVDNVPFMNKDNYDFELLDIERMEVLRGPQSTLYGRNTMGGLINIYTLSPMKYQGLRAMIEYGMGNSFKAGVSYYDRFNSRLAMSWSGYVASSDGFYTNEYNGVDCGAEKQGSLRWKTVWRAADRVNIENVAALSLTRQSGYPYASIDTDQINYNDTCFYRRTGVTDGLTVKWINDKFTLSGITSFQYLDDNMTLDQDFLPLEYFTLTQRRKELALTQDVVARGSVGDYGWTVGAFGFYKNTDMSAPVTFKEYGIDQLIEKNRNEANPAYPIAWDDETFVLGSEFDNPVWGLALYHQSAYNLDRWNFTAGIRLDYEHAALNYRSHCNTSYTVYDCRHTSQLINPYQQKLVAIDEGGSLDKSFVELLPKLSVSFDVTARSKIYASVAKGYKSGGYNTQMFSDVLQQRIMQEMGMSAKYDVDDVVGYLPEKSLNYELGAHINCCEDRLKADAAVFYVDCRDQQLTVFPEGTTTGRVMTNAGKTRSFGVEASLSIVPNDYWSLNASYGYTNARFVDFDNGKQDYSGNRLPYAPAHTAYVSASYSVPVNASWVNRINLMVNCRGVGDIYWDEANDVRDPFYALLGASVRFEHERYSLDVWGENLTNTDYKTFYFVSIGHGFYQKGKPMQVGATLRLNFETK